MIFFPHKIISYWTMFLFFYKRKLSSFLTKQTVRIILIIQCTFSFSFSSFSTLPIILYFYNRTGTKNICFSLLRSSSSFSFYKIESEIISNLISIENRVFIFSSIRLTVICFSDLNKMNKMRLRKFTYQNLEKQINENRRMSLE